MHLVLPAPVAEVHSAAQQVGLEAGLAVQGNDPAFADGAAERPQLLDDADGVVGNVPQREPEGEEQAEQEQQDNPADLRGPVFQHDRLEGQGRTVDRCVHIHTEQSEHKQHLRTLRARGRKGKSGVTVGHDARRGRHVARGACRG